MYEEKTPGMASRELKETRVLTVTLLGLSQECAASLLLIRLAAANAVPVVPAGCRFRRPLETR